MTFDTLHCVTDDGSRIGYTALGRGPHLVVVTSWATTMERQFAAGGSEPFYERLRSGRTVVMFDRRGVGASGRAVEELSRATQLGDLRRVMDALAIDECDLMGDNDGCYLAAAYAALHPERVRGVTLWAPLVAGSDARPERLRDFARLMRNDWAAACAQWAQHAAQNGTPAEQIEMARAFTEMTSPSFAASYLEWEADEDVAELLPRIAAPALVLSSRRGGARSMGVASLMPHARFEVADADPATGQLNYGGLAATIVQFFDESQAGQ
jgi:pimeloyl-ACP methyl ester carboxylesterase